MNKELFNSRIIFLILITIFNDIYGKIYFVTTYTGKYLGAGTDANVFIKMNGEHGSTKRIQLLSGSKDLFERNEIDKFRIETEDVGLILSIELSHDNSSVGSSWFLEKVTIDDESGDYYEFSFNKWIENIATMKISNYPRENIPKSIIANLPNNSSGKPNIQANLEGYGEITSKQTLRPLACSKDLGISNGYIKDEQMTASTSFNDMHLPFHARLGMISNNSYGGWCSFADKMEDYLQVDFEDLKIVTGVATQGLGLVDEWTTIYSLSFKQQINNSPENDLFYDLVDSTKRIQLFSGNSDQNTIVEHWFDKPIPANSIRFKPTKWHGKACLRVGVYGCSMDSNNSTLSSLDKLKYVILNDKKPSTEEKASSRSTFTSINSLSSTKKDNSTSKNEMNDSLDMTAFLPTLHLTFDKTNPDFTMLLDSSGKNNDVKIHKPADLISISKSCGKAMRLDGGHVLLDGEFFVDKPSKATTISTWIKLFTNGGFHTIFFTQGSLLKTNEKQTASSDNTRDMIWLKVIRGRLHFESVSNGVPLFNLTSSLVVPSKIWTHVAASCDFGKLEYHIALFVNGRLVAHQTQSNKNEDLQLSQDWSGGSFIGNSPFGYPLNGLIDEFYLFSNSLLPSNIVSIMKKCSFEMECTKPLGMENGDIPDEHISATSTYNLHKAQYSRLNIVSMYGDPARTAWCPDGNDKNPRLIINLNGTKTITGFATQGLSIFDNWVTSYNFCYTRDVNINSQWQCYKQSNVDKVFDGNVDKNSIKKHSLDSPIVANFVSFKPLTWFGSHMCMRVEIYGCISDLYPDPFDTSSDDSFNELQQPLYENALGRDKIILNPANDTVEKCQFPLGIGSGRIDDTKFSSSSELDVYHSARYGRIVDLKKIENQQPYFISHKEDGQIVEKLTMGCWCSAKIDWRQYIEVDLSDLMTISAISIQGYIDRPYWVQSFRIGYSDGSSSYHWYSEDGYEKIFSANTNRWQPVKVVLKKSIQARYVRINPRSWFGDRICLRFELYGCFANQSNSELFNENSFHSISINSSSLENVHMELPIEETSLNINITSTTTEILNNQNATLNMSILVNETVIVNPPIFTNLTQQNDNLTTHEQIIHPSITKNQSVDDNKFIISRNEDVDNSSVKLMDKYLNLSNVFKQLNNSINQLIEINESHDSSSNDISDLQSKWQGIINEYPSLIKNGITEDLLQNYSNKITDLDQKIWSFFKGRKTSKKNKPLNQIGHKKHTLDNKSIKEINSSIVEEPWSEYSNCSSSCGKGLKVRSRMCRVNCSRTYEFETTECMLQECPSIPAPAVVLDSNIEHLNDVRIDLSSEMPNNSFLVPNNYSNFKLEETWSDYTACPSICGRTKRYRYRLCRNITETCPSVGSYERQYDACPSTTYCPVLYYSFESMDGNIVLDDSGLSNNGYLEGSVELKIHPKGCGHYIDFSSGNESKLMLPTKAFRKKPLNAISIACWIKFNQLANDKRHEIFTNERMSNPREFIGGYHLEVVGKRLRWSHRTNDQSFLFNLFTNEDLPIEVKQWYHFTVAYNSVYKLAQFFLNGQPKAYAFSNNKLNSYLSTDWGFAAMVGHYDFDDRHLDGNLDDLLVFDRPISMQDIQTIMNITKQTCK